MAAQHQPRDACKTIVLDTGKLPLSFLNNNTLFCGLNYPDSLPLANLTGMFKHGRADHHAKASKS